MQAHCHLYCVQSFFNVINSADLSQPARDALTALCHLYALCGISENKGDFLQVWSFGVEKPPMNATLYLFVCIIDDYSGVAKRCAIMFTIGSFRLCAENAVHVDRKFPSTR